MEKLKIDFSKIRQKFTSSHERADIVQLIAKRAEPAFAQIENTPLDELLLRIGDARIVLLGESTHGTSEFYQMRKRITQELILKKGFTCIALEADWPDVEHLNRFIRHLPHGLIEKKAFRRFPGWMWKNEEFHSLITWLRHYNWETTHSGKPINIYGLDIYNVSQSIETVCLHLGKKDPRLAEAASKKYECLLSWGKDLSHYGLATAVGITKECEDEVVSVLVTILESYIEGKISNEEEFLPIFQNAVSIANAEEYYRHLYQANASSWNLRDQHMFQTLQTILSLSNEEPLKIVVWAHNSHIGHAGATEMGEHGEINLGQLCKENYGEEAYLMGFGTHKGTVAAASSWGAPLEIKEVRASHPKSVERLFHDSAVPSFFLPLQNEIKEALSLRLLERAIGVLYLPEHELKSHYLHTVLPYQFDEYVWFDHTQAISPLAFKSLRQEARDTYPFGL